MKSLFKSDLFPLTWIGYFPEKAEWHQVSVQTFQTENKNASNMLSALKWSNPHVEFPGPLPLKNHWAPTLATFLSSLSRIQSSPKAMGIPLKVVHMKACYIILGVFFFSPYDEHLPTAPLPSTEQHCRTYEKMLVSGSEAVPPPSVLPLWGPCSWVCTTSFTGGGKPSESPISVLGLVFYPYLVVCYLQINTVPSGLRYFLLSERPVIWQQLFSTLQTDLCEAKEDWKSPSIPNCLTNTAAWYRAQ